jgi:peptide/nickel transport system permease protein
VQDVHNRSIIAGACLLILIVAVGLAAPLISGFDPNTINATQRNLPIGAVSEVVKDGVKHTVTHWGGTDSLGREVSSRILYGIRTSIAIGITVAFLSVAIGLILGLLSGSVRWLDMVIMRIMDSMMAVPAILLAMAIIALFRSGIVAVTLALVVPEVPRVTRLVRSVVLSVREEEYVSAARTLGTRPLKAVMLHIFPNTIPPVIVQGTFICASAMLIEAVLSFLGIGIPPETPTLGNIMAEGRQLFRLLPGLIFLPASVLALMIFAINLMGDGLRDNLDRRVKDH